ncbi:unnamed protein product [Pedinophyceae sp. YPF-701]|nr:unnamed protein product [Pedinophyceae sp. YPF-701]
MAEGAQNCSHEHAAGIVGYVSETKPFTAILKQRYTDFQVWEERGAQRAELTSLAIPEVPKLATDPAAPTPNAPGPAADADAAPSLPEDASPEEKIESFCKEIAGIAGDAEAAKLKAWLLPGDDGTPSGFVDIVAPDDKARRTQIHKLIKADPRLPCALVTETQKVYGPGGRGDGEVSVVRVATAGARRGIKRKRSERDGGRPGSAAADWPGGPDRPFIEFILYKENMETVSAVGLVSRWLHVRPKALGISGTKDKRGVTCQYVSAFRVGPEKVVELNKRLRGARLQVVGYRARKISLGDHTGNRFKVVLRAIQGASRDEVEACLRAVRDRGFLNYFGLQRFGVGEVPTHLVGAALARGAWGEAVDSIMAPRPGEREDWAQGRRLFLDSGDAQGALKVLPRMLVGERAVLESLAKAAPGDRGAKLSALQAIPRHLRMMYMHALQSYFWNKAATHRVATFGVDGVVEGDLVVLDADAAAGGGGDEIFDGEAAALAEPKDGQEAARKKLARVHVVTAEEAARGAFEMSQVVLPIPGSLTVLPGHSTADVYRAEAKALGVELPSADGGGRVHNVAEFSLADLPGDYRQVVHKPRDMTWRFHTYTDPQQDLAETDLQRLQARGGDVFKSHGAEGAPREKPGEAGAAPAAELTAVELEFSLPKSAYATMLVREVTKESSAVQHHKSLGDGTGPAATGAA